jgi:RNA polymerase sigma factor (sigma-70 family)
MESNPRLDELLRHTRWIEELAQRLVRDPAAAQDLAQSAWVIALRSDERPRNLRGWLGAVLRNLARENRRREAVRPSIEREGARAERLPSSDELLARAEAERRLVEIVTTLDEPHRTTLLLRYFEGLTPAEIARREGVELASITHRITRGHARLRERLAERDDRDDWLAALVPILRPSAPSSAIPVGSLFMSAAFKIALPVVLLAGIVFWYSRSTNTAGPEPVAPSVSKAPPTAAESVAKLSAEREPLKTEPAPVVATPAAVVAVVADVGRIRGRVYRPDGQLTNGRRVRLVNMAPVKAKGQGELFTVCDVKGAFDRADLEPGVWSVSTWPDEPELKSIGIAWEGTLEGMSYLVERTVELAAGGDIDLELGAPPKNPIHAHGRVLQAGVELKPMAIQFLPAGEGIYDLKKNARVAPDGHYETTLESAGIYYVTAILQDSRPEWTVDVKQVADLELDFQAESFVLEGRVVQAGDRPVAKATVELSVAGGRRAPLLLSSMGFNASTDGDGHFRFAGLPDGNYVVHAYGSDLGAAASRVVRPAPAGEKREVVLTLEPGIRVPVRVVDAADKEKSASVFVFDANGEPLNPASGQLLGKEKPKTLIPLAPGRYSVVAAAGRFWSAPQTLDIVAGAEPKLLELRVEPAAEVEVDATQCADALIEATDEGGRRFGSLIDRARFNRAVEHSWRSERPLLRLPTGNYVFTARGRDAVLARASAGISAGGIRQIVLKP